MTNWNVDGYSKIKYIDILYILFKFICMFLCLELHFHTSARDACFNKTSSMVNLKKKIIRWTNRHKWATTLYISQKM